MVRHIFSTDTEVFIIYDEGRHVRADLKETIDVFEVKGFESISQKCSELGIVLMTRKNIIERDQLHFFIQYSHHRIIPSEFSVIRRLKYAEGRSLALSEKGIRSFGLYHEAPNHKYLPCDCQHTRAIQIQLLFDFHSQIKIHTIDLHWEHSVPMIDMSRSYVGESTDLSAIQITTSSVLIGQTSDDHKNEGDIVDEIVGEEKKPKQVERLTLIESSNLLMVALWTGHPLSVNTPPISIVLWHIFSAGFYPFCDKLDTLPSKESRYEDLFSFRLISASKRERARMTGVFTTHERFDGSHNQVALFDIHGAFTHTLTMDITHFSYKSGFSLFWLDMQRQRSEMEMTGNLQCARLIKYLSNAMSGRLNQLSSLSSLLSPGCVAIFEALYWAVKNFVPTFLWKVSDLMKDDDPSFSFISMVTVGVMMKREHADLFQIKFHKLAASSNVYYQLSGHTAKRLLFLHANHFMLLDDTNKQVIVKGFPSDKKRQLSDLILRTTQCDCVSRLCRCNLINGETFTKSERELVRDFITPKYHDQFLCVVEHANSRIYISCRLMGPTQYLYGPNLICPCGAQLSTKYHQDVMTTAAQLTASKTPKLVLALK